MKKYRLIREIGRGGTSRVYLGVERRTGKKYAIKIYNDKKEFEQACGEHSILQTLHFPAIPAMRESMYMGEKGFIVMEYVPGMTLKQFIQQNGMVTEEQATVWSIGMCDVLSYLHGRKPPVVYRDLKPANIILSPASGIKLIDFGAATECIKRISDEKNLIRAELIGTAGYAAPEQADRQGRMDTRADIYTLGATMHHMLTGIPPYKEPGRFEPVRKYNKPVSATMEGIVKKCVEKDPNRRYRFCEEIKRDLKTADADRKKEGRMHIFRSEILC